MTVKSCEKVEKSQVALTIEVNAAEFEAAVEKAYQKMRRKISAPGFRPGKEDIIFYNNILIIHHIPLKNESMATIRFF